MTIEKSNPLNILKNGYSITEKNNKKITTVEQLEVGDNVKLIFAKGIFCFVINKKIEIKSAAKIARYNANSPEETGIFLTKSPNVPNIVIDTINIKRGFVNFFMIKYTSQFANRIYR